MTCDCWSRDLFLKGQSQQLYPRCFHQALYLRSLHRGEWCSHRILYEVNKLIPLALAAPIKISSLCVQVRLSTQQCFFFWWILSSSVVWQNIVWFFDISSLKKIIQTAAGHILMHFYRIRKVWVALTKVILRQEKHALNYISNSF